MTEEWRSVPGLDPAYQVSNLGRFRALPRTCPQKGGGTRYLPAQMLAVQFNRYCTVQARGKSYSLHKLVLLAFVGAPQPGQVCRHLDGSPQNNRLDNLAWGTPHENQMDRFDHDTACKGSENYRAILTEDDVRKIMALRHLRSPKTTAEAVGCDVSLVKHVVYGQSWNWLTGLPRNRRRSQKSTRPATKSKVETFFEQQN